MINIYDNGELLLGNVKDIKKYTEYLVNNNKIDLDFFTEIMEDIKDYKDNDIICINYDNGMGYSFDIWNNEDIVKDYNINNNLTSYLEDLKELQERLVKDYNNIKEFDQHEEDRLILQNVIELIENKID